MKFTKEGLENLIERVRNQGELYSKIIFYCVGCGRRIEVVKFDGIPLCPCCRRKEKGDKRKMKLIDILSLVSFREINDDVPQGSYFYFDAKSVRIYLETKSPYFDFGIYDFSAYTTDYIKEILTPAILDREVDHIDFEAEIQKLVIYLVDPADLLNPADLEEDLNGRADYV